MSCMREATEDRNCGFTFKEYAAGRVFRCELVSIGNMKCVMVGAGSVGILQSRARVYDLQGLTAERERGTLGAQRSTRLYLQTRPLLAVRPPRPQAPIQPLAPPARWPQERKGGSGHIGKMIFSAGSEQLAVVAYVPEEKQDALSCGDWLTAVLKSQGGEVATTAKDVSTGFVKANPDKGVFPLKIREPMILEARVHRPARGSAPGVRGRSGVARKRPERGTGGASLRNRHAQRICPLGARVGDGRIPGQRRGPPLSSGVMGMRYPQRTPRTTQARARARSARAAAGGFARTGIRRAV